VRKINAEFNLIKVAEARAKDPNINIKKKKPQKTNQKQQKIPTTSKHPIVCEKYIQKI